VVGVTGRFFKWVMSCIAKLNCRFHCAAVACIHSKHLHFEIHFKYLYFKHKHIFINRKHNVNYNYNLKHTVFSTNGALVSMRDLFHKH